jgi:hypothetical protein
MSDAVMGNLRVSQPSGCPSWPTKIIGARREEALGSLVTLHRRSSLRPARAESTRRCHVHTPGTGAPSRGQGTANAAGVRPWPQAGRRMPGGRAVRRARARPCSPGTRRRARGGDSKGCRTRARSAEPSPAGRRPCPALPGNMAIQPWPSRKRDEKQDWCTGIRVAPSGNTCGCASFSPLTRTD